jgi:hypothetical protein
LADHTGRAKNSYGYLFHVVSLLTGSPVTKVTIEGNVEMSQEEWRKLARAMGNEEKGGSLRLKANKLWQTITKKAKGENRYAVFC